MPTSVEKLKKLKTLFFANNEFTRIPDVIGRLPSLFMLSFKANKLERIDPECLSSSIQWLILTDNKLEELPSSLGRLTKLRKLMLSGIDKFCLEYLPNFLTTSNNLYNYDP
jgi:Leucine-rich repeat (LRR) protein